MSKQEDMEQTKRCVYCRKKPAKIWTGHVLRGKQKIVAGWCSKKCQSKPGFVGYYSWRLGREGSDI